MLYYLLYDRLYPTLSDFRVFRYMTARIILAGITSFFLCVVLTPWLVAKFREFQVGQHIREKGIRSYTKNLGNPTLCGLLIMISLVVPTMLWADLSYFSVWIAILMLMIFAAIGFVEDYIKFHRHGAKRTVGLDGFSVVLMVIASAAIIALAYVSGYLESTAHLQIAHRLRTAELTVFCGSMAGACLGFLAKAVH